MTGVQTCALPISEGVFVQTISISPAVVDISVETTAKKGAKVETEIIFQGRSVATCSGVHCQVTIPDAKLWDADNPNLYTVKVMLKNNEELLDEAVETFGIRSLAWSAASGLEVNGKSIKLRGGCVHHDNGSLGACDFKAASYRKVRIMKEAGFNAIRSAHYPISSSMLQACDEIGMYIMDEAFDTWRDSNGLYGYTLHFDEAWQDDLSKMVLKDRNHPSVVMYSIGNEISDTARPDGADLADQMTALCHKLDPTRPVTVCPNLFMNVMSQKGLKLSLGDAKEPRKDDVTDPLALDSDSKLGGSAMINVLMATGPLLMKLMLKPKITEKGSGHTFAKVDIAGYNYAVAVYEGHHKMVPDRLIVGSETHPNDIFQNWDLVKKNSYIIGDFMWTGWDYLGEVGVGIIDYGKSSGAYIKPYPAISAYTGAVDLTGRRDVNSHLAAIVWGLEDKPFIAVQQVNHYGEKKILSHYRHTDSIDSWSWPGYEGKGAIVEVYSQGKQVELIQDGRPLGKKTLKACQAKFKTIYQPGKLEAVSYDSIGKEIGRSFLVSAGSDTILSVHAEKDHIKADGEDLSYINVEVTDQQGIVKMLSDRKVNVRVEGAGTLQAVGSANPRADEPYTGTIFTTYQGRMQIVVRSGVLPGEINVNIVSGDLASQVKIQVR